MKRTQATPREIAVALLIGVIGGAMIPFDNQDEIQTANSDHQRTEASLGRDTPVKSPHWPRRSDQR